ncbi:MAG TPA: alpha/beta fold hydrolase [Alphaproteobacteria bacterium]|nr:alpha/beta fold hydrolase [Alphaproteobacteria bacterium]
MRGSRWAGILAVALALAGGPFAAARAESGAAINLKSVISKLGGQPCPSGNLTCVSLEMPVDHRANDPSAKLKITFAVSFASAESKGILFYVVGGPGGSGLGLADDYLSAFDERLTQNMDIVFFDQRGIGPDHGLECPKAQGVFDSAELSVADADGSIATAKRFAADCVAELKSRDLLPYVETDQAIRDLEQFRLAIGDPKVWIYGESYGTQFAQQYATAFPAAVKGVIVDGVVDLTLSFGGYYAAYTEGAERILARVLASCGEVPGCRDDMRGDAAKVYDDLAAQLAKGPIEIDFPMGDGTIARRKLTSGMLDANAFYSLYGPDDRAGFLRALAAASRGQLLPMLRLGYSNLALDPGTELGTPDPSWFGAAYYAITCTDYAEGGEDRDATARQIMADAAAEAPRAPRLLRSFYAERLACAYWPRRGPVQRPAPFAGGDYPTLVLNADTDPITPISMSYAVMDHVKNGYLVAMEGGPHVIWGRGLSCPDEIVYALLFDGTLPEAKEQICSQSFIGAYERLTMTRPGDAADPYVLARALETEIDESPPLYNWDGGDSLAVGCDHGGTVEISAAEEGTAYAFTKCAWWPGIVLDGTGISIEEGAENVGLTLDLAVSGDHQGQITYRHNTATDAMTLNGTYDGKVVATPRPLP